MLKSTVLLKTECYFVLGCSKKSSVQVIGAADEDVPKWESSVYEYHYQMV